MRICPRCSEMYPDDATRCPKDGADLRAILDPLIGKTVGGRYRLISRLGSGGMSSVYLARHVLIDRLVAVKTLRRDLAQDPVQRDRFIREARAVNRINHENIVEITDFGETEDGLVYLVMEYVPGEPLLKSLGKAPFASHRALAIAEQCAGALGRAHQMGVVHRDLKPENILLQKRRTGQDFVKVLDFGIAKILDAPSLTGSQQIFGTPGYIAPEYIQSTHIDGRADLYSLGVILYEMVTGALPFDYEYPGDLLVKHVTDPPIPPRERHPSVDVPMAELILQCLEKDPGDRFRDAYHFLDELRRTRERLGTSDKWGAMAEPAPRYEEAPKPAQPLTPEPPDDELAKTIPDTTIHEASAAREPRDTVQDVVPRFVTTAYERPSIPLPPSVDGLAIQVDVEIAVGPQDERAHPSAADTAAQGLLGVRRWRERFERLRSILDEIEHDTPAPPDIVQAMAHASDVLDELEGGIEGTEVHQREIEELDQQARELRATMGRAIDALAKKLSKARGDFEVVATRRNMLQSEHETLSALVQTGRGDEGRADAVLWELATVEEEMRERARGCDDIEGQLATLRKQLEERSAEFEARVSRLALTTSEEMQRLDPMALALREPLDRVEAFVRDWWEKHPAEDGRTISRGGSGASG